MIPTTALVEAAGKECRSAAHASAPTSAERHVLQILSLLVIGAASAGVVVANAELLRLTVEADTPLGELGAALSPDTASAAPRETPIAETGAARPRSNERPSPIVTPAVAPRSTVTDAPPAGLHLESSHGIGVGILRRPIGEDSIDAPAPGQDVPSAPEAPQPPQTPQAEPVRTPAQASDPDTDDESEEPPEDEPETEEPEETEQEDEPGPEPGGLAPGIGQ